ncbi:MAG: hypothetical protein RLY86_3211 [Pseudomonadota bacterium]|jgi:short-subunit dehydrogenase
MAGHFDGRVVVITGASSGIGRATARAFAAEGATVVLSARREQALHMVAREITAAGGRAMVLVADVRDPGRLRHLAERAAEAFGGIDIWINNAGIAAFGTLDQIPEDAFAQVMETTFMGVVNGVRAVLPIFKAQGHGVLITTASVVGRVPTPYQSPYVAAKHAVLGFLECVRQELREEGQRSIQVGAVLPGPVDTPFWQHAANYTGREIQALPGTVTAEAVAGAMLRMARHPRREIGVGASARMLELGMALAGGRMERSLARTTRRHLFGPAAAGRGPRSLMRPDPNGTGTDGGWKQRAEAGSSARAQGGMARVRMGQAGTGRGGKGDAGKGDAGKGDAGKGQTLPSLPMALALAIPLGAAALLAGRRMREGTGRA